MYYSFMDINKINLRQDYVLIRPAKQSTEIINGSVVNARQLQSGLYITEANDESGLYEVLKTSPNCKVLKVGDLVLAPTDEGQKDLNYEIEVNGETCLIWREADLFVKIEQISL